MDDPLAAAFGKLGLSPSAGTAAPRRTHLIVDALNYLSFFVPAKEPGHSKSSPWSLHAVMQQRVAAFLRGCALSGWEPHFVIDTGYQSAEALDKWEARREEEVRAEYRSMPCGAGETLFANSCAIRSVLSNVILSNGASNEHPQISHCKFMRYAQRSVQRDCL